MPSALLFPPLTLGARLTPHAAGSGQPTSSRLPAVRLDGKQKEVAGSSDVNNRKDRRSTRRDPEGDAARPASIPERRAGRVRPQVGAQTERIRLPSCQGTGKHFHGEEPAAQRLGKAESAAPPTAPGSIPSISPETAPTSTWKPQKKDEKEDCPQPQPFDMFDIPDGMDAMGFTYAAHCARRWFNGQAHVIADGSNAVVGQAFVDDGNCKLKWVRKFGDVQSRYDQLLAGNLKPTDKENVHNNAARTVLLDTFRRFMAPPNHLFSGTLDALAMCGNDKQLLHQQFQFQRIGVSVPDVLGSYTTAMNDLAASLANFEICMPPWPAPQFPPRATTCTTGSRGNDAPTRKWKSRTSMSTSKTSTPSMTGQGARFPSILAIGIDKESSLPWTQPWPNRSQESQRCWSTSATTFRGGTCRHCRTTWTNRLMPKAVCERQMYFFRCGTGISSVGEN